jgi:hypothetical protein
MAITLRQADADFEQKFQAFLASKREDLPRSTRPCAGSSPMRASAVTSRSRNL